MIRTPDETQGMSGIEIKHLVQTSGSITLSFGVSGLSWEKLTTTCRCADRVKLALEEAIAFAAGSDVDPSQVSVALQRGAASGASLAAREAMQPPQAVARQAPPSSEEEQDCKIGQEKLKLLLNGSSIPGEGADGKQGLPEAGPPKSAEIMESLANALSGHRLGVHAGGQFRAPACLDSGRTRGGSGKRPRSIEGGVSRRSGRVWPHRLGIWTRTGA